MFLCTDSGIDIEEASVQEGVDDFVRFFRQHATSMLTDGIRRGMNSAIGFDFSTQLMMDLILQQAVSGVVQHLTAQHASGTFNGVSHSVANSPTSANDLAQPRNTSGFDVRQNGDDFDSDSSETIQPSFIRQHQAAESGCLQQIQYQHSPHTQTLGETLAEDVQLDRLLPLGEDRDGKETAATAPLVWGDLWEEVE